MKARFFTMIYKTFWLHFFPTHTHLSTYVAFLFFFAYSSTSCTHTFVCLSGAFWWWDFITQIVFHCTALWISEWTAHLSFSVQRQTGLGEPPEYTPSFISGAAAVPPQPQAGVGSACPWGSSVKAGVSVSTVASINRCGQACVFPSEPPPSDLWNSHGFKITW